MGGIRLDHVVKVYPGDVTAIDDVDLEIGDGEFVVLVGPSGCGKSTLLRMVAGLEPITGGEIDIAERVDRAAGILELQALLQRTPRQLSGGQRQRVAMGRAIVREPAVFLFDEPLSNLDAKLRVQMRFEIQKLHRRLKTTSLYVTHDHAVGERLSLIHI